MLDKRKRFLIQNVNNPLTNITRIIICTYIYIVFYRRAVSRITRWKQYSIYYENKNCIPHWRLRY